MARTDTISNFLTDVAESIRTKKGTTDTIQASNFDTEIESIETGGGSSNLQSKSVTITENGTQVITPDDGYDGMSDVEVITDVSGGTTEPEIGVVINSYDSNGYPTELTLIGYNDNKNIPISLMENPGQNKGFCYQVSKVNFKNCNISSLNDQLFYNCVNLSQLTLPSTITKLGYMVFGYCTRLPFTSLPSGVTSIGDRAFQNCTNLALTELPDGITSIGQYVFYSCTNLAINTLSDNITSIGQYAFYGCSNMPLSHLPSGLTSIADYCFQNCTNLALTELPDGITSIGYYGFRNCSNMALSYLPESLTTIRGNSVFMNCKALTISKIPNGVTKLDYNTFANCYGIKKISMNNVTALGGPNSSAGAFYNCTSLKQVWIGSAITSANFARYVFTGCTNLEKMYIDLPRATVEAFTNYQYAFMNDTTKTGIIVCNDDEGFITKEEFDLMEVE